MFGGVEVLGGALVLIGPETVIEVLLGGSVGRGAIIFARFFGIAIFTLGLACLMARDHLVNPAGLGLAYSAASYNLVAAVLIIWVAEGLGLGGSMLKAAGLGHAALGLLLVRGIILLQRERLRLTA
jgi:hypothetical protein